MNTKRKSDPGRIFVERRTKWTAPKEDGPAILCMPNIPFEIQGDGCQPRSIMGRSAWDICRKKCYYQANYRSQISGEDLSAKGQCQAHELFSYDFSSGTATFERYVCISPLEHIYFIHSGRAITFYKKGDFRYSAKKLLEGAEHGFRLISEWNRHHPSSTPLRPYATFLEYLKQPELADPMTALIKKYDISFWAENQKKRAKWGDWKVVINNKTYPTPYKDREAWEKAMEKHNQNDKAYTSIMQTAETKRLLDFLKDFE